MTTNRMTDEEVRELLTGIFETKPEPPVTPLPEELQKVKELVETKYGITLPTIVILSEGGFTGHLDFNWTYSQPAIEITKTYIPDYQYPAWRIERTIEKMARTLIHEAGHWIHHVREGATYESHGFTECENYAYRITDEVLTDLGWEIRQNA